MSAEVFSQVATGKTAREAFGNASEAAAWDHGHAGYTGTIAEKPGFVEFQIRADANPVEFMDALLEWDETAVRAMLVNPDQTESALTTFDDKWDDAVAVKYKDEQWLFGGWASC